MRHVMSRLRSWHLVSLGVCGHGGGDTRQVHIEHPQKCVKGVFRRVFVVFVRNYVSTLCFLLTLFSVLLEFTTDMRY